MQIELLLHRDADLLFRLNYKNDPNKLSRYIIIRAHIAAAAAGVNYTEISTRVEILRRRAACKIVSTVLSRSFIF